MKFKIIMMIAMSLGCMSFLSGCASTNGWGYPSDCCFYRYAQCGSCGTPPACNTCTKTTTCSVQAQSSCGNCMTSSCNYSYKYTCCENRDYWSQ